MSYAGFGLLYQFGDEELGFFAHVWPAEPDIVTIDSLAINFESPFSQVNFGSFVAFALGNDTGRAD